MFFIRSKITSNANSTCGSFNQDITDFRWAIQHLDFCNRFELNSLKLKQLLHWFSGHTLSLHQALEAMTAKWWICSMVAGFFNPCLSSLFSPLRLDVWKNLQLNSRAKAFGLPFQWHCTARRANASITCFAKPSSSGASIVAGSTRQETFQGLSILKSSRLLCLRGSLYKQHSRWEILFHSLLFE